ncbi:MAG: folylpolyglutamate synthase/dihydrofolate synthase family protein [Planctomycetota bacterium]|nr:folylpolyglutamate synthase/dihydrofolate synthase family protein [Planctomycetota bacterium]
MPPAAFSNFGDCLSYLARFTDYERMARVQYGQTTYNLDRMRRLLDAVGAPHLAVPTVHITGTKGKGSTARMLHHLLRAHGLMSGVYTSPHLVSLLERIHVGDSDVPEAEFVDAMNVLRPYLVEMYEEAELTRPTFFEIVTAVAFLIFRARKAQCAIIEVGVGGRLDATNVVAPLACAVTLVHYDHMDKLGDTIEKIAFEKAGIIKPGVPVVTAEQDAEAYQVIERTAREKGAPLRAIGRDFSVEESGVEEFSVKTWRSRYDRLRLPVIGTHQRRNAAVALALLDCLAEKSVLAPSPELVRMGFASVELQGRLECFSVSNETPLVIIDGAHNEIAMETLAHALRGIFENGLPESCRIIRAAAHATARREPRPPADARGKTGAPRSRKFAKDHTVFVVGMSVDKEMGKALGHIINLAGAIVLTAASNPRAAAPERLLETCRGLGFAGKLLCVPRVADALETARDLAGVAGPSGLVVVTGSFYVAGEARAVLAARG